MGVYTASSAFVGGNWNNDLMVGPFYANLNNTTSNSNSNNGAALSYPKKFSNNAVYIAVNNSKRAHLFLTAWWKLTRCKHLLVAENKSNADERIRENMKSYNHLHEICISETNRRNSLKLAKHSKRIRQIMKNRHLSDDAVVEKSYEWIINYENAEHVPVYIYDGITRKERTIIVPTMEELFVQHCVVNALKPMFCKGMYEHSYASLPGRGAHKGKKVIEKWIRADPKNCKYVLKMDIRHFFDSVPHDRLKAKLRKTIHDEKMLDLLFRIIDVTEMGIPLGFYTSQWLSNWYLQGLDHYIKEKLGAVHYMRYMDDMVIFGSNKQVLHQMRQAISEYLEVELGLKLKGNWQVFRFSYGDNQGRDLDFMGFRFYRNKTILRKTIMYKATRKAKKISKKERPTIYDARQMLSYLGWIDCTDTYRLYRKRIKPYVNFQRLKRKVSQFDRYDERRVYHRLVIPYTGKGGKSNGSKLSVC